MAIDAREVTGSAPTAKKVAATPKKTATAPVKATPKTATKTDAQKVQEKIDQVATEGVPAQTAPTQVSVPATTVAETVNTNPTPVAPVKTVVSTFTDNKGQQVVVYNDGSTTVVGTAVDTTGERKSAFDLLKQEFTRYGLDALIGDTLSLAQEGVSPAEFSLRLRQTEPYKKRFAANEARIKSGLSALSEAQYIALEDQYQNIMREYGLPKSFYATTEAGRQPEFEKFIAGDVSPTELETRVSTAVNRVKNASPDVMSTLAQYYPGITQENLVAYVLDPAKALPEIQRQVQAAEIGGAASRFGLAASRARAEELAAAGVNKAAAEQGFQTIAEVAPRGGQLASFYKETPYTQTTAEQEVFGLAGSTEAAKQRKKLTQLEQASFSGQTGMTSGALNRERAGSF